MLQYYKKGSQSPLAATSTISSAAILDLAFSTRRSCCRPFGDVMKFRANSSEREENAWVLGCRLKTRRTIDSGGKERDFPHVSEVIFPRKPANQIITRTPITPQAPGNTCKVTYFHLDTSLCAFWNCI